MDFIKGRSRDPAPMTSPAVTDSASPSRPSSADSLSTNKSNTSKTQKPNPKLKKRDSAKTMEEVAHVSSSSASGPHKMSFEDTVSSLKKQTQLLDSSIDSLKLLMKSGGAHGGGSGGGKPSVVIVDNNDTKPNSGVMNKFKGAGQQVNALNTFATTTFGLEDRLRAKRLKELQTANLDGFSSMDSEMDPVMTGDIILLENSDAEYQGMLLGDRSSRKLGVQGHSWLFNTQKKLKNNEKSSIGSQSGKAGNTVPKPLAKNMENAAFRIIPKLKHGKRDELDIYLTAKSEAAAAQKAALLEEKKRKAIEAKEKAAQEKAKLRAQNNNSSDPRLRMASLESAVSIFSIDTENNDNGEDDDEDESSSEEEEDEGGDNSMSEIESVLRQKVQLEDEQNELFLEALQSGFHKTAVRYGTEINLQHVNSGLYVTVVHAAAPFDPDCRTLVLGPCSKQSTFKLMPRYKAQSNGSVVFYKHWLRIESSALPSNYVHTSPQPYSPVPNPTDMSLPKCLRTGVVCETNLSSNFATFIIQKRCRNSPKESAALQTNYPVRFYHSQSESFVTASGNQEKGRNPGSYQKPEVRDGGMRMHVSYLKMLSNEDGTPQPGDPGNHNTKQLWAFEPTKRSQSGAVCWASPIRIRHVMSGKYLAINTDIDPIETEDGESHYTAYLCDDAYSAECDILDQDEEYQANMARMDGDANGALDLTFPSNMLFYVLSTDRPTSNLVPHGDIAVRIEHRYEDPRKPRGQRSKVLYFHNSENPKPESESRMKTAEKLFEGNKKDKEALHYSVSEAAQLSHKQPGTSFLLVFSDRKTVQDTFMMMPASPEEVEVVNQAKAFYVPFQNYVHWVKNDRFAVGKLDLYPLLCQLFLDLMALLVKGGGSKSKKDKEYNWVNKANNMLPAEFSKLFDGEPFQLAQDVCREMKLLDVIFAASVAPYIRTYPLDKLNPFATPNEGDELSQEKQAVLDEMIGPKAIQKFTHAALQRLTLGNAKSQKYFGNRNGPSIAAEKIHESGGKMPTPQIPWMDSLTSQLEEPLGAAVTLAALLSASKELMKDYATPHFVDKFADMVSRLGPQPRLVKFFHSLCVVGGKAIKANQELVLQQIWIDIEKRSNIMLEVLMIPPQDIDCEPFSPVIHPLSGQLTQPGYSDEQVLTFPTEYLGMNDLVYDNEAADLNKRATSPRRMHDHHPKKGRSSLASSFFGTKPLSSQEDAAGGEGGGGGVALTKKVLSGSLDFGIPPNTYNFQPVYVKWRGAVGWRGRSALYYPPSGWSEDDYEAQGFVEKVVDNVRPIKKKTSKASQKEKKHRESFTSFGFSPNMAGGPPYEEYLGYPPIPSSKYNGDRWITSQPWKEVQEEMKDDPYKKRCFERQCQLAGYFEAQIQLMGQMCYGRSDNCCAWLAQSFPYPLVVSTCSNIHLPPQIRAAFAYLARTLYMDRTPQSPNCGRPSLPEQLWIYQVNPIMSTDDFPSLPIVRRNLKLEDDAAFPCFNVPPSHPLFGDADPLIGFPTHTKFFLLRLLGNNYIKDLGDGCISHEAIQQNELTHGILRDIVQVLLSFGFQSTFKKIQELLVGVVKVLDGRNDVDHIVMTLKKPKKKRTSTLSNASGASGKSSRAYTPVFKRHPFEPLEARFRASPASSVVANVKVSIIGILMEVSNLRANFRLAKLLDYFKVISEDHHKTTELKRLNCYCEVNKMNKYDGSLLKSLHVEFEDLFTKGDGARMGLDVLSGMPVNTILLDCLMYDDDDLFASALGLLERGFKQRSKLLEAISSVILLETEHLPIYEDASNMLASISNLSILVDVHETWGVSSNISQDFDESKYQDLMSIANKLQSFMVAPPGDNLNIQTVESATKKSMHQDKAPNGDGYVNIGGSIDTPGGLAQDEDDEDEEAIRQRHIESAKKRRSHRGLSAGGFGQTSLSKINVDGIMMSSRNLSKERRDVSLDRTPGTVPDVGGGGLDVMGPPAASFLNWMIPAHYIRQDTLRAMNLHKSLFDGLEIDINLSFRGSQSSNEEKIKSRKIFVNTQIAIVDLLVQFVRANKINQELVWNHALSDLTRLTGPLPLPELELTAMKRVGIKMKKEDEKLLKDLESKTVFKSYVISCCYFLSNQTHFPQMWPKSLGTERVIVECLRGNEPLAAHKVPKSLVERFGELLEAEEDLSTSPLLDFFCILCQPEGPDVSNERNQELVINVLLNPTRQKFRSSLHQVFFCHKAEDDEPPPPVAPRGPSGEVVPEIACAKPEKIVRVLCTTIDHMNQNTATILLTSAKLTMDAVLYSISKRQNQLGMQFEYHTDQLLCALVELLGSMMQVLMIDPRLFVKKSCWDVVTVVGRTILSSFVAHLELLQIQHFEANKKKNVKKRRSSFGVLSFTEQEQKYAEKRRGQLVVAIFKIVVEIIKGARSGGLQSEEAKYKHQLVNNKGIGGFNAFASGPLEDELQEDEQDIPSPNSGRDTRSSFESLKANHARGGTAMRKRVSSTAATAPPISESLEGIHLTHQSGSGFGLISGKTTNEIINGCEDILRLLLPTSSCLRKTTPLDEDEGGEGKQLKEADEEKVDESAKHHAMSPVELFDCFSHVLRSNPIIVNTITMRRFKFAEVLENSSDLTTPPPVEDHHHHHRRRSSGGGGLLSNLAQGAKPISPASVPTHGPNAPISPTHAPPKVASVKESPKGTQSSATRPSFNLGTNLLKHHTSDKPSTESSAHQPSAAVVVSFSDIIYRMMRYTKAHNFDKDETSMIRIFNVLMAHLLKSRGREDGALYDIATDLEGQERSDQLESFKIKQNNLNKHGVTTSVLNAIATHSPSLLGNCADVASYLLKEILRYGNTVTQNAMVHYITNVDNEAKVLNFLKTRLLNARRACTERRGGGSGTFEPMGRTARKEYEDATHILSLLKLMMEGHYLPLQDLLRCQPKRDADINLIEIVNLLFTLQAETTRGLMRMEELEVDLLMNTMEVLIEAIQGPCGDNQLLLVSNPAFFNAIDKVIQCPFHARVSKMARLTVKSYAVSLLSSCLEGRLDNVIHEKVADEVLPLSFDLFRAYISNLYASTLNSKLPQDEKEEKLDLCTNILVDLSTIYDKMQRSPKFSEALELLSDKRMKRDGKDAMDSEVCKVEVNWNGSIEVLSFKIPHESRYLSLNTKLLFELRVDLRTAGKRMGQMLSETPNFIQEMKLISNLCEKSKLYAFLFVHVSNVKWALYGIVVLLNLNLLMVTYGKYGNDENSKRGFNDISSGLNKFSEHGLSVMLSVIMGGINLIGYLVLIWFLAQTEVPMVIHQSDTKAQAAINNPLIKESMRRNRQAFGTWSLSVVAVAVFIMMHWTNYDPSDESYDNEKDRRRQHFNLYAFLGAVLGFWLLICVRNYIVVPDTKWTRNFNIVYDLLMQKEFFRNNVLLIICTILGFQSNEYFSLMLFDIMNNSALLANILKCIFIPGTRLIMVFYLLIATSVLYAQFGLKHFEGEDWGECHSAMSCFWLTLFKAVPSKQMFGHTVTTNRGVDGSFDFQLRMLFNLVWFIWNFLLFKVMTGLILSTFGKLRAEDSYRDNILKNTGFVSGIERAKYGDLALYGAPSYDELMNGDQYHWNYVNLVLHLIKKNPVDYTGCETFVKECLDKSDLRWLPAKTSFAIQLSGAVYDAPPSLGNSSNNNNSSSSSSNDIISALSKFSNDFELLRNEMSGIQLQMTKLEEMEDDNVSKRGGSQDGGSVKGGGATRTGNGGGGGGGGGFGGLFSRH